MDNLTKFHQIADKTISHIADIYELRDNLDIDLVNDILHINAEFGEYVINKHAPTRQVWVSSPKSGAHHFKYEADKELWISTKNDSLNIFDLLSSEIKE